MKELPHAIASEAGLDAYVAECLPETKVNQLKLLIGQQADSRDGRGWCQ